MKACVLIGVAVLILNIAAFVYAGEKETCSFFSSRGNFELVQDGVSAYSYCSKLNELMPDRFGSLEKKAQELGVTIIGGTKYSMACHSLRRLFDKIAGRGEEEGRFLLLINDTDSFGVMDFATVARYDLPVKWNLISLFEFWFEMMSSLEIQKTFETKNVRVYWTKDKKIFFKALLENDPEKAYRQLHSKRVDELVEMMKAVCILDQALSK